MVKINQECKKCKKKIWFNLDSNVNIFSAEVLYICDKCKHKGGTFI